MELSGIAIDSGLSQWSPVEPAREAAASHLDYLFRMAAEGVVSATTSAKAKRIWELARGVSQRINIPLAVAHEVGSIHYTWDDGRYQVACEAPAEGPCDWYVSDRDTGEFDGGEFDPAQGLPAPLIAGLKHFSV